MDAEMKPKEVEALTNDSDNSICFEPKNEQEKGTSPALDVDRYSRDGLVPEIEYVPRGDRLWRELSGIQSTARALEAASWLPSSKDVYARSRRRQLRDKLTSDMDKLRRFRMALDREVLRCQKNLETIRSDAGRLNLPEAMEHYSEAERQQRMQHYKAVSDRDAIVQTLTTAQAALRASQNMGVPTWDPFPPDLPARLPLPGDRSYRDVLGNEVDGLLSLGPLGSRQRQRY
jgi:hypothetical protein